MTRDYAESAIAFTVLLVSAGLAHAATTAPSVGTIAGTVTLAGKPQAGETLFLGTNIVETQPSAGEQTTTTNTAGVYTFTGVPLGSPVVRQVLPLGMSQITPSKGYGQHVTLSSTHPSATAVNFTNAMSATPVASVATQPTGPTPATPAQISLLEPSVPAGTAVHLNAYNLLGDPKLLFGHVLTTDFGPGEDVLVTDPLTYGPAQTQVNIGRAFPGPGPAHVYETPGVKTIVTTDHLRNPDGTAGALVGTYTTAVTVTPANRTLLRLDQTVGNDSSTGSVTAPYLTLGKALGSIRTVTELQVYGGAAGHPLTYTFGSGFAVNVSNVRVVGYGPEQPILHFSGGGGMLTTLAGASRDITFENVAWDSDLSPGTDLGDGLVNPYVAGAKTWGNVHGTNISLVNCTFLHLVTGPRPQSDLHGFLMQGCTQPVPKSCYGQLTYDGCDNSVYVGNYFSDAVHESVNRWDNNGTVGGATNVTYALNRVARSYGDKSAVEVRSLTNGFFCRNLVANAAISVDSGANGDTVNELDMRGNVSVNPANSDTGTCMTIKQGIHHAAIQDNKVWAPVESYDLEAAASDDITFRNNWGCGWRWNNPNSFARLVKLGGVPTNWQPDAMSQGVFTVGAGPGVAMPSTQPSN